MGIGATRHTQRESQRRSKGALDSKVSRKRMQGMRKQERGGIKERGKERGKNEFVAERGNKKKRLFPIMARNDRQEYVTKFSKDEEVTESIDLYIYFEELKTKRKK